MILKRGAKEHGGEKGAALGTFLGTYYGLQENLQPYLDELCFRFCRHSFAGALLNCLSFVFSSSVWLC